MPVKANPDNPGGPIESQWDLRRYPVVFHVFDAQKL